MANLPPVAEISVSRFGGKTAPVEAVVTVEAANTLRIPNNPNRLNIAIINQGSYDIRVSNTPDVGVNNGWLIAANGGVIAWDWNEDGEAVTYELYLIAIGSDSRALYREVIRL